MRWSRLVGVALLVVGASRPGAAEGPTSARRSENSTATKPRASEAGPVSTARPDRIWANSYQTWIYEKPQRSVHPLGYLRAGGSARLASPEPLARAGCSGGWYAVQPAGYVCLDHRASLTETRYVASMRGVGVGDGPLPFRYALSYGTPTYRRLPTADEAQRAEAAYGPSGTFRPLPRYWRGHEELAESADIDGSGTRPNHFLGSGSVSRSEARKLVRRAAPFGTLLAYTSSFEHGGRVFLQSADGTAVPADRVRPFRESTFEGSDLATEQLPLAWARRDTPLLRWSEACGVMPSCDGAGGACTAEECFVESGRTLSLRQRVQIADAAHLGKLTMLPLRSAEGAPRLFVKSSDVRVALRESPPPELKYPGAKWISFSISRGTLVAYEGERPLLATLASPGEGGVPVRGADALQTRTTPVGTFRIQYKHLTDDMSPEWGEHRKFWIAEVPFTQYFKQPFAIHVAYWHESFGEPMSGGCINVSPRDGKWLFGFTDPPLPEGWHGVGATAASRGTLVVIRR